MKVKSSLKIALTITILSSLVMGGVLFIASKRFKPEELKKIVITQLQKSIPNSNVTTKSLDFSIGLSSSLEIRGVDISLKGKRKYPLVSIDLLELKIPFWSLLFGGGKVELVVGGPKLHYIELGKGSNWEAALKTKASKKVVATSSAGSAKSKASSSNEEGGVEIPGFLASSELNISIKDLVVNYSLRDKSNGKVVVEKFLLKDVGVKSTTGFELKSKINILKGTANQTELDILIIGESKLYDWLSKEELSISTEIVLSNIKSKALKKEIKNISVKKKIKIRKDLSYDVNASIFLEEQLIFSTALKGSGEKIEVKDIKLNLGIKDALSLLVDERALPLKLSGKEKINIEGSLVYDKKIIPDLLFNISPPLNIKLGKLAMVSTIKGVINRRGLDLSVANELLSGRALVDVQVITNWTKKSLDKLKPIRIAINVSDLKITPKLFSFDEQKDAKSSGKKSDKKAQGTASSNKQKKVPMKEISPLPLRIITNLKNIDLAGANLAGEINIRIDRTTGSISTTKLMLDKGELTFKDTMVLKSGVLRNDFDVSLKNLNLSSLAGFIPKKMLEGISGRASGKVQGNLVDLKYFVEVDFRLKDGLLTKINMSEYVSGLVNKLGPLKKSLGKDKLNINGEFKSMILKGSFANNRHQINKFKFDTKDGDIALNGKGNIYPNGHKTSRLFISLAMLGKEMIDKLKKDIGTNVFPMKLEGLGYALSPDYGYTIKKVGKSAVKAQAKKQVKKKLKNLFKDKKKMKKLFKGLF